jgi:lipopolysaccharide export system protein LptA
MSACAARWRWRLTALAVVATVVAAGDGGAAPPGAAAGALQPPSGPMTIRSDRMTVHEAERRATFEGQVVVQQGDLTVKADRLDVWVNDTAADMSAPYGSGNVSSIRAGGHVEVVHGDRRVLADQAVYDQARQQIELIGNLRGEEGGYTIAGRRMVIYLQERRSVIEGSQVTIPPGFAAPSPPPAKAE